MSDVQIENLFKTWLYEQASGRNLSAEELCADCPELIPALRDCITQASDLQVLQKPEAVTLVPVNPVATGAGAPTLVQTSLLRAPDRHVTPEGTSRYHIVRSHARGGLGEVFLARDQELERDVALKTIQAPYADEVTNRMRFIREGKLTGCLEHPGIVPVYGLGAYADGRPYYAMRLIKGESLKEAIDQFHQDDRPGRDPGERALAFRQLLQRFINVCNAIEYAHSRNVLHRDLKPANIMLGPYGETLVVDWGLAKVRVEEQGIREANAEPAAGSSSLPQQSSLNDATQIGSVIGTPAYMSPEQAAGRLDELGPASDLYSLGATLYCLLTGHSPIAESNVMLVLASVQMGEFPRPRQVKPVVPRPLEVICLKAMALNPKDRYSSARALADELEHWLADEPVAAYRESSWERTRRLCRHRPIYAATLGFLVAMDLSVCGVSGAAFLGWSAAAMLPYMVFGAVLCFALALMFLAQIWWLLGALAGAIYGSPGARNGGLIGLIVGGSIAWAFTALPGMGFVPAGWGILPPIELVMLPLAGAAFGIPIGLRFIPRLTKGKKPAFTFALLGSLLGFVIGSMIATAAEFWEGLVGYQFGLTGSLVGVVAGVALGIISAAFRAAPWRVGSASCLGALVGATLTFSILQNLTLRNEFSFRSQAAVLVGGLLGATLAVVIVPRAGEARQNVVVSALIGGRVGIAAGTLLFSIALAIIPHLGPDGSALSWLALPVILVPPLGDFALGWMARDRWSRILTRITRSAAGGAILGGTLSLMFMMYRIYSQLPNASGAQQASRRGVPATDLPAAAPANPNRLGNARLPGRVAGTKDPFQTMIETQEKLTREKPGDIEPRVLLAGLFNAQAMLSRNQGNSQGALVLYDRAITALQPALDKDPRHSRARQIMRDSHSGRAETLVRLNRAADALAAWNRTLEFDNWPNHNEFRLQRALTQARLGEHDQATVECDALAEVKNLSPATLFSIARVYALSAGIVTLGVPKGAPLAPENQKRLGERYAGRAIAALATAESTCYFKLPDNMKELKISTDFDSLRSREDFKSLVARLPPAGLPGLGP